jgi:hypothetical protein
VHAPANPLRPGVGHDTVEAVADQHGGQHVAGRAGVGSQR